MQPPHESGARITAIDRAIIRMYPHPDEAGGLASEADAQPGAGLWDRDTAGLPAELERRLTPLPKEYCRVRRGRAVLLMDARTHKVIDIARGI